MSKSPVKLYDAWRVRFTHFVIENCSPFTVLWGVNAAGEAVCASKPQALVGNTIQTQEGVFEIEGELKERSDIPLEYREALCLGVTPTECVEFSIHGTPRSDVMKFAEAKRLKRKLIGEVAKKQEGLGL